MVSITRISGLIHFNLLECLINIFICCMDNFKITNTDLNNFQISGRYSTDQPKTKLSIDLQNPITFKT